MSHCRSVNTGCQAKHGKSLVLSPPPQPSCTGLRSQITSHKSAQDNRFHLNIPHLQSLNCCVATSTSLWRQRNCPACSSLEQSRLASHSSTCSSTSSFSCEEWRRGRQGRRIRKVSATIFSCLPSVAFQFTLVFALLHIVSDSRSAVLHPSSLPLSLLFFLFPLPNSIPPQ